MSRKELSQCLFLLGLLGRRSVFAVFSGAIIGVFHDRLAIGHIVSHDKFTGTWLRASSFHPSDVFTRSALKRFRLTVGLASLSSPSVTLTSTAASTVAESSESSETAASRTSPV